jgi:autotransporter-associated beta strand protein
MKNKFRFVSIRASRRLFIPTILATAVAFALSVKTSQAVDRVWGTNLGAGPHVWNTGTNWTGGTAAIVVADRGDLRKDWTAAAVINFSAATTNNGILFDDAGLTGDVGVTIGNGGTAANTLTLGGTTPVVQVDASTLSITAIMAGSTAWSKTGAGTLILSGVNTSTAAITVSAGTLRATTSVQALGTGAATLSLGGGTLELANDTGLSFARNTTVTATSTITVDRLVSAATSTTHTLGTLSIGAQTLNITRGTNITGAGIGGVTFGAATLTSGSNNFAAAANTSLTVAAVSGATFTLNKSGAGIMTASGIIGTTSGGLAVTAGTLVVGNAANTFTGNITVAGASSALQMTSGSNGNATSGPLGINTTVYKTVTLTNGGIFRPSANYNVNTPSAGAPGAGQVFSIGTGGGVFDVGSGVTFTVDDGTGAASTAWTAPQLQGSGALTKTGVGTLSLGASTSNFGTAFTGTITVSGGLLQLGNAGNPLGNTTAGTTISSGAALNVNGTTQTVAEPLTINGTGLASSAQGALTNNSATAATWVGPITLGSAATIGHNSAGGFTLSSGATVNTAGFALTMGNNGSGNFTVSGVISGVGSVTVSGTGQYVPNVQSTYSGGTSFNAGTSTIPQVNSTGNPGSVTSGPFGTEALTFVPTAQIRARVSTVTTINNNVTLNGGVTFLTAAPWARP